VNEAETRKTLIDPMLDAAGWAVQDRDEINLSARRGVAVREFKLKQGHGFADYLLFVDGKAVGVVEAKALGHTLTGVEFQSSKYATGLPDGLNPRLSPKGESAGGAEAGPIAPLPFLYQSTGAETRFTNLLDPAPRSRRVFAVHRPETMAAWLKAVTLDAWVKVNGAFTAADDSKPSTLRARLTAMPPLGALGTTTLYANQIAAITGLEHSLKLNKPKALIQMATGSGKTIMAVAAIYRMIKFGGARRVLFLVDRSNLGEQAEKEFESFRSPDDNRKFTELYNVQRLESNTIGASSNVVITTIQRLYSMLKGEAELPPEAEAGSGFAEGEDDAGEPVDRQAGGVVPPVGRQAAGATTKPLPVVYNPTIPPEHFDIIFVDECHRSIYSLWRQVLEYFDAFLIGLTATPAKHTYGFFEQNLVMEYGHAEAVADRVNVDFEVYRIRTVITEQGSKIESGFQVGYRDARTRKQRWTEADEDISYDASDLDRDVVAKGQIRVIVQTLRDRVFPEAFPGRKEVPKTLIFAKDDSHAEDILEIVRQEFGRGNDFASKITYKTTGLTPKQLIHDFRTGFFPRISITVDLIATGTDIKPIEAVVFLRTVKSKVLFEQMKGRGVRTIDPNDLQGVSGKEAGKKTHFLIVDCVGVTESPKVDTRPLERKRSVPMKTLLELVALGSLDPDVLSSVAARLARLDKECGEAERKRIAEVSKGATLASIAHGLIVALDSETHMSRARADFNVPPDAEPTDEQIESARVECCKAAAAPLAENPDLRKVIQAIKDAFEQVIDEVSKDELILEGTGFSAEAKAKAQSLVQDFESFLADEKNRAEIDALQFFYSVPHRQRLRFEDVEALARVIQAPPRSWTPEKLWHAYELLDRSKVRGASGQRLLTDVVSLVRFALHQDDTLVPHADRIRERFEVWMAQQATAGRVFTADQIKWLEMIRNHVAESLEIRVDDFALTPFVEEGGLGKAAAVFGKELGGILKEINEVVAA
jgi:type I restriction enzyme R subunit